MLMKNQSLVLLIIAVIIVAGTLVYAVNKKAPNNFPKQQCTMEAKICPDGSAVARTGPNCEFAECPNTPNPAPNPTLTPTPSPTIKSAKFDTPTTLNISETVTFSDGLRLTLNKIDDSRCPAGVQCIWAGELAGMFTIKVGTLANTEKVRLGTANNKKVIQGGYTFELISATEKSITISVKSNQIIGVKTDTVAPVITLTTTTNITANSSRINWSTNENATSKVYYTAEAPLVYYSDGAPIVDTSTALNVSDGTFVTSHSISLTGLNAHTVYHFIVESRDTSGNTARSTEQRFNTAN